MSSRRSAPTTGIALVVAVAVALALSACGVSSSDGPTDLGNAYEPAKFANGYPAAAPNAGSPTQLVDDFLGAAAGGGEDAVKAVQSFLTEDAQTSWRPTPGDKSEINITILQTDPPKDAAANQAGIPVTVLYRVVGHLDENGLVNRADRSDQQKTMTFQVVPTGNQFRIAKMDDAPAGLFLSDRALNRYYRQQAIYFWDQSVLVPDLRYVPLVVPVYQQANLITDWLSVGQSTLLGAVIRPPNAGRAGGATVLGSTLTVKLNPQASKDARADQRLYLQLQASLRPQLQSGFELQLIIGTNEIRPASGSKYIDYELSSKQPSPTQKYDIVDEVVKMADTDQGGQAPILPLFAGKEYKGVQMAAVNRENTLAALVRKTGSDQWPTLWIVGGPAAKQAILPHDNDVGRPAWIPGTNALLIPWHGNLYAIDSNATPRLVAAGVTGVTAVTIAPDGRRVALIAGGKVHVAQLIITDKVVSLGAPQAIPAELLSPGRPDIVEVKPTGVAWQSEGRVFIVGTSGGAGAWLSATIDGAIVINLSAALKGERPADIVSYPESLFSSSNSWRAVMRTTSGKWFKLNEQQISEDTSHNPFWAA